MDYYCVPVIFQAYYGTLFFKKLLSPFFNKESTASFCIEVEKLKYFLVNNNTSLLDLSGKAVDGIKQR